VTAPSQDTPRLWQTPADTGQPTAKKARLYEEGIDVLLEHWRESKGLSVGESAQADRRALKSADCKRPECRGGILPGKRRLKCHPLTSKAPSLSGKAPFVS